MTQQPHESDQMNETGPGHGTGPDHQHGADIVHLDTARDRRQSTTPPTFTDPTDEVPADGSPVLEGKVLRVDQPGGDQGDWLAELAEKAKTRRPIVPLWLRSRSEAVSTLKWVTMHYAYVAGYQLTRTPKYAVKLAVRAPRGTVRLVGFTIKWTFDLEGEPVRMAAVLKADPEAYLKLSRQRDARVRLRVWISGPATVAATLTGLVVATAASTSVQALTTAGGMALLGLLGAPADQPLIDRAVVPTKVEKLTSDIVIRALTVIGVTGINAKNADIKFVAPITRDGPGWRADVDLPYGVTVADVMDKRDRMASALRRPLGCIWPEGDATVHEGRLILWVGDRDLSKTVVRFKLAKATSHDVFKGIPFGSDPRGRTVTVPIIQHNILLGSLPGQGKTAAVRALACGSVLDPTVEPWIHELKGTGDLDPLEPVCHRYVSGIEDEAIAYAAESLKLLRKEVMRRSAALKSLPPDLCPDKRVTRQIADRRPLGLHPLVCVIDECQNLFAHPTYGDQAGTDAEFIIKLGRALGVTLILATQRPDKDSLPTGVSANVSIRFCLKVGGQIENDMILGTSAYKNGIRATVFVPEVDAGIGYLVGATPMPKVVRSAYLDTPATQEIAGRALAARKAAGTLSGHALGEEPEAAPSFDLLADIAAVIAPTEAKVWNEIVVDRLAELRPDVYGPWARPEGSARTAHLTVALKPYGVTTGQVWGTDPATGKGANRTGIIRDDIMTAITQRDGKRGSGPAS